MVLGRALRRPWAARKANKWVREQIQSEHRGGKMPKLQLSYFGTSGEGRVLWKRPECRVNRRKQEKMGPTRRWMDSIKEATG